MARNRKKQRKRKSLYSKPNLLSARQSLRLEGRIGDYHSAEHIGTGGQGEAFKMHSKQYGDVVAKVVNLPWLIAEADKIAAKAKHEVEVLSKLSHPQIPSYIGVEHIRDESMFVFYRQFIEGQSLHERIKEKGPMQEEEVTAMLLSAAQPLEYLHDVKQHRDIGARVIHRDVKPENLIISSDGIVHLIDFEVAKTSTRTITDTLNGTFKYIAPEQFKDWRSGPESDIYSLGATAIEALLGKLPEDFTQNAVAGIAYTFDPKLEIESSLAKVIEKMVEPDVKKRYKSVEEVVRDLDGDKERLKPKNNDFILNNNLETKQVYLDFFPLGLYKNVLIQNEDNVKKLLHQAKEKAHAGDSTYKKTLLQANELSQQGQQTVLAQGTMDRVDGYYHLQKHENGIEYHVRSLLPATDELITEEIRNFEISINQNKITQENELNQRIDRIKGMSKSNGKTFDNENIAHIVGKFYRKNEINEKKTPLQKAKKIASYAIDILAVISTLGLRGVSLYRAKNDATDQAHNGKGNIETAIARYKFWSGGIWKDNDEFCEELRKTHNKAKARNLYSLLEPQLTRAKKGLLSLQSAEDTIETMQEIAKLTNQSWDHQLTVYIMHTMRKHYDNTSLNEQAEKKYENATLCAMADTLIREMSHLGEGNIHGAIALLEKYIIDFGSKADESSIERSLGMFYLKKVKIETLVEHLKEKSEELPDNIRRNPYHDIADCFNDESKNIFMAIAQLQGYAHVHSKRITTSTTQIEDYLGKWIRKYPAKINEYIKEIELVNNVIAKHNDDLEARAIDYQNYSPKPNQTNPLINIWDACKKISYEIINATVSIVSPAKRKVRKEFIERKNKLYLTAHKGAGDYDGEVRDLKALEMTSGYVFTKDEEKKLYEFYLMRQADREILMEHAKIGQKLLE